MKRTMNLSKDTTMMTTLLVAGLLMASLVPVLTDAEPQSARSIESAAITAPASLAPAAMLPILREPAIIVTAPRIVPATQTAKSRRLNTAASA